MNFDSLWSIGYALVGGIGVKAIDMYMAKKKSAVDERKIQVDEHAQLRDELWGEINKLRDELHRLEEQVNHWKNQYYELLKEHVTLEQKLEFMRLHYADHDTEET